MSHWQGRHRPQVKHQKTYYKHGGRNGKHVSNRSEAVCIGLGFNCLCHSTGSTHVMRHHSEALGTISVYCTDVSETSRVCKLMQDGMATCRSGMLVLSIVQLLCVTDMSLSNIPTVTVARTRKKFNNMYVSLLQLDRLLCHRWHQSTRLDSDRHVL